MTLWLMFALMTAAAIFAVLWPLSRPVRLRSGSDLAVYRDQLDEVARDRAAGLIGEAEAQAAQVEVSRRLIAAGETAEATTRADPEGALRRRRWAAVAALVLVPVIGAGIYLRHGSPALPGAPLAERANLAAGHNQIEELLARAEAQLERNPDDGRGWEVLAPIYLRMGRIDDAVKARRNALRLNGETVARQADLGEALTAAANGIVTAEAKGSFERAAALDPKDLKSRFYLGLAAEQDGDRAKAAGIWQSMMAEATPDAPWVPTVREALARVGAPGPSAADIASANSMSEGDRADMIRGMVARLAEKLKSDGSDVEGWLRLIRAYMVMGERDKANAAAGDARRALTAEPDKLRRIDEFAKSAGLNG